MCKLVRACDYSPKLSRRPCDCHTSTADGINATIQSGLLRRITFIIHPGTKSAWFRRRRIIMRCLERRRGRQDGYVRLPGRDSAGPNGISPCYDPPSARLLWRHGFPITAQATTDGRIQLRPALERAASTPTVALHRRPTPRGPSKCDRVNVSASAVCNTRTRTRCLHAAAEDPP